MPNSAARIYGSTRSPVDNTPFLQRDPNPGGVGTYGERIAGTAMDLGIARTIGSAVLAYNPELWVPAGLAAGSYLAYAATTSALSDSTHQKVGIDPQIKAQVATLAYSAAARRINTPVFKGGQMVRRGAYVPDVD